MRTLLVRCAIVCLVVLILPIGSPAQSKCEASKWRASAKLLSALSKCESRAAIRGTDPESACIANAEARFSRTLAKLETKGGCDTMTEAQLQQEVGATVRQLGALIDTSEASSCCDFGSLCHARPADDCVAIGGMPGPAGSICSGTGSCETPAVPGNCCLLSIGTCIGGPITSRRCIGVGGFLFEHAVCDGGGACVE